MTVNPATCLNGGTKVTVSGSGFDAGSLGNVLECNNAKGQPTVALPSPVNENVQVSCTGISTAAGALITVGADGTFSASFTVIAGKTGPPCGSAYLIKTCPSTDSTGGNPVADAANYPCPPTAAQVAAGDQCSLAFGDSNGATQTVLISFVSAPTPGGGSSGASSGSSGTSGTANSSTTATTTPATAASTLAFTGSGPDTWYTLFGALLLLDLGFLLLTLYYRPRELAAMLRHGVSRTFGARE